MHTMVVENGKYFIESFKLNIINKPFAMLEIDVTVAKYGTIS